MSEDNYVSYTSGDDRIRPDYTNNNHEEYGDFNWLAMMTTVAARHALAHGMERELVADTLDALANAIRYPQDVAENMGPLTNDDIDVTGPFMIVAEAAPVGHYLFSRNYSERELAAVLASLPKGEKLTSSLIFDKSTGFQVWAYADRKADGNWTVGFRPAGHGTLQRYASPEAAARAIKTKEHADFIDEDNESKNK